MGQGGHVVLVNATPYAWDLVSHASASMEWEFDRDASAVDPYTSRRVYVENQGSSGHATATYTIRGRHETFTVHAHYFILEATMDNFGTKNAAQRSAVPLGLISDRPSYFVLSGESGNYHSVGNVRDWMSQDLSTLGHRKLRDICIPFSHDSGMSVVSWTTAYAAVGSVATQYKSVENQLKLGIRYFDIRPVLKGNRWVCGHYSFIGAPNKFLRFGPWDTWQGGDGESLQDIIDGINNYTSGSNELIVLNISETRVINEVKGSYARGDFANLDTKHWNLLLDTLTNPETGIKKLWNPRTRPSPDRNLTELTLHEFIGSGTSAVIALVQNGLDLSGRRGIFGNSNWQFNASAWDKPDVGRMKEFQDHMSSTHAAPFLFSGCHTQSDAEAIKTTLGQSSSSVLSLATSAKDRLFTELFSWCGKEKKYPSSMSLDGIDSSDLTALCMAFNDAQASQLR